MKEWLRGFGIWIPLGVIAHSDRSGHLFRFDSDSETENVGQGSDFGRTVSRSEATLWVVSLSA